MPRRPRFVLPGQPQHVIQRGNNRTPMFLAPADYQVFRRYLAIASGRHECQIHAYVLMPNHVHLLMTPRDAAGLAKAMQSVGRRYVGYFNAKYKRTGTLWEGRYRATPIHTERYLFTCYRYIELNPVRAGLAATPADYPWSSYRATAQGQRDALVTAHDEYWSLGADAASRRAAYRGLFDQGLTDSVLQEVRAATNKCWPLGNDRFRLEVAALVGRRAHPLRGGGARAGAGRPRGPSKIQREIQRGQSPLN